MDLVDLEPGDGRLATDVFPVLHELRPHLTLESFAAVYAEGHPQGLRFSALYEDGRCVAVAGWRVVATTSVLRKLYVDDLVTTSSARSRGHGRRLLAVLTERARQAGCRAIDLDSGVQRTDAHRFYEREQMVRTSHHFARRL
jgi:GNAT superfamily N-acetyltransferase